MTRDYSSRGLNRARYLFAGQPPSHTTPYRAAANLRHTGLPVGLSSPSDLDFMDAENPFFFTDRALHSAGHYIGRTSPLSRGTFSRRAGNTILFDSGGLQFGRNPAHWQGDASRDWCLRFLEKHADEAITLDVPTRVITPGQAPFDSFQTALAVTLDNNRYFARYRSEQVRFLTVLQGETPADALTWYQAIKTQPFEGWAFGGSMRTDYIHVAGMVLRLIADGLLGPERNRLHFLGVSSLSHAVMLSALQIALRSHLGDDELLITFDTSTPSTLVMTGQMFGYPQLAPSSFTMSIFAPPSGHVHAGWTSPFPVKSSRVSEGLRISDLCSPASTRQYGWDMLGMEIVTNHNAESLLRGIDEANSVMELPSAWAASHAPVHVIRAYRALKTMFEHADPLAHVRQYRADFAKL